MLKYIQNSSSYNCTLHFLSQVFTQQKISFGAKPYG